MYTLGTPSSYYFGTCGPLGERPGPQKTYMFRDPYYDVSFYMSPQKKVGYLVLGEDLGSEVYIPISILLGFIGLKLWGLGCRREAFGFKAPMC